MNGMIYYVLLFATLMIAVNRCCMVTFPLKYKIMFSRKRISMIVGTIWVVSALFGLPLAIPQCVELDPLFSTNFDDLDVDYFKLKPSYLRYLCGDVKQVFDLLATNILIVGTLIVDVITFKRVYEISKERLNLCLSGPMRKELKLCKMIAAEQILSVIFTVIFYVILFLCPDVLLMLMLWALCLLLDGAVIVFFTPRLFKRRSASVNRSQTDSKSAFSQASVEETYTRF
ncbi:hypothetical protein QR680_007127 [Steinernema hermaphroditum]|uniref:G-protein coupled receptors family 1 profile domain-containing protein n=1 Tax=Steinernema hermaphroditum TaxID=289476 RepID=A0AA39LYB0_9BILA|nr:hypothetical protein QR680_007127 [Steinernema hermaphroditum]